MSDDAAAGPLEDREVRNLASATGAAPDLINRVLAAAAEAGIAYLLPALRATGHYPEFGAFALPGAGKCAHFLIEGEDHGLCGVPLPYAAVVDLPRGTPLCIGCAWHARRLTAKSFDARRVSRAFRVTESRGPAPIVEAGDALKVATFRPRSTPLAKALAAAEAEPTPPAAPPRAEPSVEYPALQKAAAVAASITPATPTPAPPADNPPSLFDLVS